MTDRELAGCALLPCPFCGFVPTIEHIHADESQGTKWGGVICDCGVRGPEVRTGYAPVSEWANRAIAEWNRRTPSSEGDARPTIADLIDAKLAEGDKRDAARLGVGEALRRPDCEC